MNTYTYASVHKHTHRACTLEAHTRRHAPLEREERLADEKDCEVQDPAQRKQRHIA
jgi:hypothetical protein